MAILLENVELSLAESCHFYDKVLTNVLLRDTIRTRSLFQRYASLSLPPFLQGKGNCHMTSEHVLLPAARPCISRDAFQQIAVGDLIIYLLTPNQQPTNPLQEWHGRVEQVSAEVVLVSSLDEGYIGEKEMVRRQEIISVSKSADRREHDW